MARTPLANSLPDFPWDSLAQARAMATAHPDGIVDLSVGNPVDPVAPGVQLALSAAAGEPGYPATEGTADLRAAIAGALARRHGIDLGGPEQAAARVLPVVGLKEAIAFLPLFLGLRGAEVIIPKVAYPTYEVAALTAGAVPRRADDPAEFGSAALVFLNTPSNPTGEVLGVEHLRAVVDWARANGAIVVSDECYLPLGWEAEPVSVLDPRVCGGDVTRLLSLHSLSKSANLASYRAGMVAGDENLIAELTQARKQVGLTVPGPIQAAMVAALEDDATVEMQKLRYARRRAQLLRALHGAGFDIQHSEAGLYLWATRGEDCRATVEWLASLGLLVAPGDFYAPGPSQFVRIGLNGTDERIAAACERLAAA